MCFLTKMPRNKYNGSFLAGAKIGAKRQACKNSFQTEWQPN